MTFDVTEFVKAQKAAQEKERAAGKTAPNSGTNTGDDKDKSKTKARPYYATQDQTSLYEEYLFGRSTYAQGAKQQTWSDSMLGRSTIRLASRGLFGAMAFTWGGHMANVQLRNYVANEVHFNVNTLRAKPLQLIAKTFDTVFGAPIKAVVHAMAPAGQKEVIAERAVRFRQKNYYHNIPGREAGRSLGAEMVAVTFDFACASAADSAARGLIQLGDPNIQKPWRDKEGHLDIGHAIKATGSAAWRIFSKNQGEDWAAALPYVYQMKLQRNAIARWAPGFKLSSDMQVNGASSIMNRQGQLIGDYQKQGAFDLQLRFMGYNWYTLMYREAYDAVSDKFHHWKNNGFQLSMPEHFNPVASTVEGAAEATRYVIKSAIKSGLYMAPSVPFFWMFRTPQSKWRAPLIYDNQELNGTRNAFVMRTPGQYQPTYSDKYDATEFQMTTAGDGHRVWQGGIYTNELPNPPAGVAPVGPGERVTQGYFGRVLGTGENRPRPIIPMGGDEAYKWKNQKTTFSKILNPFGWVSYNTGTAGVRAADWLAGQSPTFAGMFDTRFSRERHIRTFIDASYSYTPYMIAKAEFALHVDDRGPGGSIGEMDKAINKGIDSFVTFDMKGFTGAVRRMGDLMFNVERDIHENGAMIKEEVPSARVYAQSAQLGNASIPALKTPTSKILAQPHLAPTNEAGTYVDKLANQRNAPSETFLYPESRTIQ